ncbi:MAG: ATP-binding protein [Chloroflexi bacterium]|nr:ATP-binding protein [Chloroflexota bacterium]
MNQGLSAAHSGYQYQDLVVACALIDGLVESFEYAVVDKKALPDDRFDDLEVSSGGLRRRNQIKWHGTEGRRLGHADLTTDRIRTRIDALVATYLSDPAPADEYRLTLTYGAPTDELAGCLVPNENTDPLLRHVATRRYKVDPDLVWPVGQEPRWAPLREGAIERDAFSDFCRRFVIETGLPGMSKDLRDPGPLEQVLLQKLGDDIGVGLWPNQNYEPVGAAALLIRAVTSARSASGRLTQADVLRVLGIRTDYGRVAQRFPLNERVQVKRGDTLEDLSRRAEDTERLVVVGPPGSGKSWALTQLAERARAEGHLVATHYCYLDLDDDEYQSRTEAETMFGSLVAELLDAAPDLAEAHYPRYTAGPEVLERLVAEALERDPSRRIILIVDGLDHISRIRPSSVRAPGASTEVATELAILDLPSGATLVIGSQPGSHLEHLLDGREPWELPRWSDTDIADLAKNLGLPEALELPEASTDYEGLLAIVSERSAGNPLYATYLCQEVLRSMSGLQTGGGPVVVDLAEYVDGAPPFDAELSGYYHWLLEGLEAETGTPWLAELMASIDFAVDRSALAAIRPEEAPRIAAGLARLHPVLRDVTGQGGMRIYHESFQRFIRARIEEQGVHLSDVLGPVIDWLENQGLLEDSRAFRFLLPLLLRAGRDDEVLARVDTTFVADSVSHGHPGAAVLANLAIASQVASKRRDWPALIRVAQLSRAARACYEANLEGDLAHLYGRTFAELFSMQELAERLLFDGRTTFSPRVGLVLCELVDEAGVSAPWPEYARAYNVELESDNSEYGPVDHAVELARFRGWLRSRTQAQVDVLDELAERVPELASSLLRGVIRIYADIGGSDLLLKLSDRLEVGGIRALCHVELGRRAAADGDAERAADEAQAALDEGVPDEWLAECIALGADPGCNAPTHEQIVSATRSVVDESAPHYPDRVARWVSLVKSAAFVEPALLRSVDAELLGEGWYRDWLRFVVELARVRSEGGNALPHLIELSRDTDPFKGTPRACDLYGIWSLIHDSLAEALGALDDDQWPTALEALSKISSGTTTMLPGETGGPLTTDALLKLLVNCATSGKQKQAALELASRLVSDGSGLVSELYSRHASHELWLTRLQHAAHDEESASTSWRRAAEYLAGYGWRRDTTIFELLDPLPAIARYDPAAARGMLAEAQKLVPRVLLHTDGKETRHADERWNRVVAEIDPAGAAARFATLVARMGGRVDDAVEGALPVLLDRAREDADPLLLAGLWYSASVEEIDTILGVVEALQARDPNLAGEMWRLLIASIEGDRVALSEGLNDRLLDFTSLHGLSDTAIDVVRLLPSDSLDGLSTGHIPDNPPQLEAPFDVDSSPLEIVRGLRTWSRAGGRDSDVTRLANALGWRLIQLADEDQEADAARILDHAASDIWYSGRAELLGDLGEGLARHGRHQLAARAFVLALTRSRGTGGWGPFGGPECHQWLIQAIQLDEETACDTLAAEVAERAAGESWGMTPSLVESFLAIGDGRQAVRLWRAAYEVIARRLPMTSASDEVDIPYRPAATSPSLNDALAMLLVALLNDPRQDRKRRAATILAVIVTHDPSLAIAAIREAFRRDLLVSSVLRILEVIEACEQDPFVLTSALGEELRALEETDILGFRVLGRRLLQRVTGPRPLPAPPPSLSAVYGDELDEKQLTFRSRGRLEQAGEMWPDFPTLVSRSAAVALDATSVEDGMRQSILATQNPGDRGRDAHIWYIADEVFEEIVQTHGSRVRAARARSGQVAPEAEEELASVLLEEIGYAVRAEYSRTTRPSDPLPSELADLTGHVAPIEVGEWAGWYRVGHTESELMLDEGRIVAERIIALGGIVFPVDGAAAQGQIPFHNADWRVWEGLRVSAPPSLGFNGPLAGLFVSRHPLGWLEVVCPHPIVWDLNLEPASAAGRFQLDDPDGNPAIVGRQWRMRPIGSDYVADQVHRLSGADLLIRGDIFASVKARASADALYSRTIIKHSLRTSM